MGSRRSEFVDARLWIESLIVNGRVYFIWVLCRDFANDGSVQDSSRHKLNRALLQLPGKGDFDLRNVLDSVYFFS